MSSDTPMLRQYNKIKASYPDAILLFRLGDFYEMFNEDAKNASKILGITLTSRNKSDKNPVPLCGVPFHSVEPYIAKLLDHGHKVAICEQIEDPKLAKGVVERKVIKLLTPGVILDSEQLKQNINNYVACLYYSDDIYGLSYVDISTGDFRTCVISTSADLKDELFEIAPREIILCDDGNYDPMILSFIKNSQEILTTKLNSYLFDLKTSENNLKDYLNVNTLHAFGLQTKPQSIISSGVLIHYLTETQMDDMPPLKPPVFYSKSDYLQMDDSTRTNLELTRSIMSGEKEGTLLSVIDETLTAMGGRLLRQWLNYPLINADDINLRLDKVGFLKENKILRKSLRASLREISDIERLISRICTSSCKPRDLGSLRDSILFIQDIKKLLLNVNSNLLSSSCHDLDELQDIYSRLRESLVDEPPNSTRIIPIIRSGLNTELDDLRSVSRDAKKWIAQLEAEEKIKTGINFLKVGYNKVFGYYIEVTKPNIHLVPNTYIRKQTLVNAERFITPELKEFEEKIYGAEDRITEIEQSLFEEIRLKIASSADRVRKTSEVIAELDVFCAFSEISEKYNYSRPQVNTSTDIKLLESRHPVVERMDLEGRFIPNNVILDNDDNQLLLITGPNMAGKSTLIRQTALCVLLAHIGSFVPAKEATIGVVDKIFTRVGASDNLTRGQSTFMVEMVETAYILRNATGKSLVILDEIGRGTSTFDGMSIAWSVAEYLHEMGCKTMFATHYHELAHLESLFERVKNYNVCVKEVEDNIVFLRKLIPGAASHSYGIQVAKLAGIPESVLKKARMVLYNLEKTQSGINSSINTDQLELFGDSKHSESLDFIKDELQNLDISDMTPLDALIKLSNLKDKLDKN